MSRHSYSVDMADALAVCSNEYGEGLYVPAHQIHDGQCFEPQCDCTPRIYVAVDTLLTDEFVKRAFFPLGPQDETLVPVAMGNLRRALEDVLSPEGRK